MILSAVALGFSIFVHASPAQPALKSWAKQTLSEIKAESWTDAGCQPYLSKLGTDLDRQGTQTMSKDDLLGPAPELLETLWQIRLALHDRLGGSSDSCAREIRNTFRRLRFVEDYLAEINFDVEYRTPEQIKFKYQPTPIDEEAPGYFLQKRTENFDFKPGDLIVARGVSFLSAMISRLGDVDSQFSHVVFVTENPETHAMETIESYVGSGVAIYDRVTALRNENARLLVLRAKDQALAKKASEDMRKFVIDHQGELHYDYALDFKDHTTYSCAEIAQVAYFNADKSFNLPERASKLNRGLDLLQRLGIQAGDTFTPGDLEYDSRFEIVAEWRDLYLTRDSRLKDAIMTKVLTWMDQEEFVLHPSFKAKLAAGPVWSLRRTFLWPLMRKILGVDEFSKEIPRNMLGTVSLINEMGEGLLKELRDRDEAKFKTTGLRMNFNEIYQELENIRSADEETFNTPGTRGRSILFKYLRP